MVLNAEFVNYSNLFHLMTCFDRRILRFQFVQFFFLSVSFSAHHGNHELFGVTFHQNASFNPRYAKIELVKTAHMRRHKTTATTNRNRQ